MFFVRVSRSRSLQNRSGTCSNAWGVCFASNLHMEMGKIIGKSIRSKHFGILQFWEFVCQPFGENISSKNGSKTKIGNLKNFEVFQAFRCSFWVRFSNMSFPRRAGKRTPKIVKSHNVRILSIFQWFYPFPYANSMQKHPRCI